MKRDVKTPVRFLIADDHPVFSLGMQTLLSQTDDFRVVAKAQDGAEALLLIKEYQPDIAILDVDMPRMSGLEVADSIKNLSLGTKVILITYHWDSHTLNQAFDLSVGGIMMKQCALTDLPKAIAHVRAGKQYIGKKCYELTKSEQQTPAEELSELTDSEINILRLVAANKSTQEIADQMFVSPKTIKNHRYNICRKLKLTGNNSLLSFALKHRYQLLIPSTT